MSLVLSAIAAADPSAPALSGLGINLTYGELHATIEATAAWLAQALADAPPEAPVALALDNGPAWVTLDLALIALGRPALPLPPFFTPEQRQHALYDAGACLLIRPAAPAEDPARIVAGEAVALQPLVLPPRPLHRGTAKVTYTSGSTGRPKGVCLSQAHMEAVALALVQALGADYAGVHLPVLPLGVLLENVAGLYPTLLAGGHYHVLPLGELGFAPGAAPDILRFAGAVDASGATSLILVPELLRALTMVAKFSGRRPEALRLVAVGGAKVAPALIAAARAAGLPAYEGYGLSECASVVALNTPHADAPGTVGRLLPHLKLTVADDGELVIGGPVFLGYVGEPPHTGPLRTGDLGAVGEDGFIRISGRKKNVLITAYGRNVSPEWVESELTAQPEIGRAVVFGDGAPELCAIVTPSTPAVTPAAMEAAVSRANASLPDYARIGRFRISPPFDAARGELTGNGRPRREAIAATHRAFIEAEPAEG